MEERITSFWEKRDFKNPGKKGIELKIYMTIVFFVLFFLGLIRFEYALLILVLFGLAIGKMVPNRQGAILLSSIVSLLVLLIYASPSINFSGSHYLKFIISRMAETGIFFACYIFGTNFGKSRNFEEVQQKSQWS